MPQRNTKKTTEEFIEDARKVHGDKYCYNETEYINCKTKVKIKCPIHGIFEQTPSNHLYGYGCLLCAVEKANSVRRLTKNEVFKRFKEIHGNKYDYSKIDFRTINKKEIIICPEHGEFEQILKDHLRGHGCPKCGKLKAAKNKMNNTQDIVNQINEVHQGKYNLDKFVYNGYHSKSIITCPIHGDFMMTPANLLHKSKPQGCPKCSQSRLEVSVGRFLDCQGINYFSQQSFEWLRYKYNLRLDYYLPEYNIAIECQGKQHFVEVAHFGGLETLRDIQERDNAKFKLCQEHGIKILYYSNLNIEYPYKVYTDLNELLNEIRKPN